MGRNGKYPLVLPLNWPLRAVTLTMDSAGDTLTPSYQQDALSEVQCDQTAFEGNLRQIVITKCRMVTRAGIQSIFTVSNVLHTFFLPVAPKSAKRQNMCMNFGGVYSLKPYHREAEGRRRGTGESACIGFRQ